MYAKNLLEEAAAALSLGKGWLEESPHKEEFGFVASEQESAFARHDGAEGDPGGADGRLVGGDEECGAQSLDDGESEGELHFRRCRKCWRGAQISGGGSVRQSKDREE